MISPPLYITLIVPYPSPSSRQRANLPIQNISTRRPTPKPVHLSPFAPTLGKKDSRPWIQPRLRKNSPAISVVARPTRGRKRFFNKAGRCTMRGWILYVHNAATRSITGRGWARGWRVKRCVQGRRWREREKGRAESNGEVLDILNFHLGHDHLGLFRPIDSGPSFRWETDDQLGTRREREKRMASFDGR